MAVARPLLVELLLLLSGAPLLAQDRPLLLEIYGGAAVPVRTFADGTSSGEGATPGPALSVLFARPSGGWRTLYLGFSQNRFGCEDAGCAADGRLVATGFNAGLRIAPVRGHLVMPWVRLGAITTRVETGDLPVPDPGISDLGVGGEIGAGIYVGGDRAYAVNPSVTLSMVDTTLPGGDSLRLRYLTAHLGIVLAF